MKLGLDTYSFHIALAAGTYDIFAALDQLDELGLSGLQININGPNGRFLDGDPGDREHVRRVRQAIDSKGFFVEIGGSRTQPERMEWQLRLAAAIGADVLRTLLVFRESVSTTFARTRRDIEAVLPLARDLGVRIAFENHEDVTAQELRRFLDEFDDPHVGACFDSGNDLVVFGDPLRAAEILAGRAISTHFKDQKLVRVGREVYSVGVPLGTGDLPLFDQLAAVLRGSSLDRILLQDTTGYASPLNPFKRADLRPGSDHADLPFFPSARAAAEAGYLLGLDALGEDALRDEARRQDVRIAADVGAIRGWLALIEADCAGGAIARD